jgi:hypothetical protein
MNGVNEKEAVTVVEGSENHAGWRQRGECILPSIRRILSTIEASSQDFSTAKSPGIDCVKAISFTGLSTAGPNLPQALSE